MPNRWTPIDASLVTSIVTSGATYEIPRQIWPFGANEAQFQRMFVYRQSSGTSPSEKDLRPVARLVTERVDSKDSRPMNYDWYSIVQSLDGTFLQSGPHKDVDFGHHLSSPVSLASIGLAQP